MNSETFCTDDDMSFDDDDIDDLVAEVAGELEHVRIEITGMTNVLPVLTNNGVDNNNTTINNNSNNNNNNDWDAESYANDSIPLAKLRLLHHHHHPAMMEDDWTVQSDCNDSIGLATKRLSLRAEEQCHRVIALQRIPRRRRASMGEVFVVEQQQQQQSSSHPAPPTEELRRVSMEESTTTSSSTSATIASESSDPVRGVTRHKSMPLKAKSSTPSTIVPMWQRPHKTMARRFSNSNGSNCAA